MPTPTMVLTDRQTEDPAKLKALREAVQVGIDDFADGRCRTFESCSSLRRHLATLTGCALADRSS